MAETLRYGYLRDYGLNVLSQDVKVAWGYSSIKSTFLNLYMLTYVMYIKI